MSPATLWDEQRELTGTDLFKAVRGRIRYFALQEGKINRRKSPRRACEMAIGFIQ